MRQFAAFIFWTAWSASTNRPGDTVTYTNNWPHEPLVGNRPTGESVMWTGVSIIMLLAGICAMVWWYAAAEGRRSPVSPSPPTIRSANWRATPSQRATLKYFWVVAALILVQMLVGVVTAHYGVEGDGFYGIPALRHACPTASPAPGTSSSASSGSPRPGSPPVCSSDRCQRRTSRSSSASASTSCSARLLLVVVGSLTGEWLSVQNKLSDADSFLLGHQGYEYVDLGRVWQILLFVGLLIWLFLVVRCRPPGTQDSRAISAARCALFLISSAAIGLFYGAGLTWGQHTHLSIVEYWRWWVVHLWVEGFFEVFATTVIAFFFTRLGLIRPGAGRAGGAAVGHHLPVRRHHRHLPSPLLFRHARRSPWPGAPSSARLEVVPLTLVGFDAHRRPAARHGSPWVQRYNWPIYFFVAVAFWNMVGRRPVRLHDQSAHRARTTCRASTRLRCTATPRCSASTACWASA